MNDVAGCRAVVAVRGLALGETLARGLERLGGKVARLPSGDDWNAAMDAAVRDLGGLDLVVHAEAPAVATRSAEIDALSLAQWQQATSHSLYSTLCCLQAARRGLRAGGGTIIVLGPTAALVGAPGLVPLLTLVEAQRTLVKSAARQWGAQGIRLHWLGLAARHYSDALGEARIPPVPELGPPPPALGRVPDAETDAAELIALLAGAGARGITGAMINLDGGDWMVP
ncbi:SDR family oxidoreductase [Piscinibacter sp. XHJ-5]|uniref:SDR family oxidoreductase n=1 Tax=Piscinibacter sp. XHJ-5 TaxID=3037797 RepID=UPI002452F274|nr:SDR family oxidoreductase [Piscinibacter sp. XHJ-5]